MSIPEIIMNNNEIFLESLIVLHGETAAARLQRKERNSFLNVLLTLF